MLSLEYLSMYRIYILYYTIYMLYNTLYNIYTTVYIKGNLKSYIE